MNELTVDVVELEINVVK
jgi:hypothetical protein